MPVAVHRPTMYFDLMLHLVHHGLIAAEHRPVDRTNTLIQRNEYGIKKAGILLHAHTGKGCCQMQPRTIQMQLVTFFPAPG